ncbi:MAG TPA: glycosyltransferase family 2 protein [Acidobacteriota bacterium]|nr:glycosyltransferase family 2 protein [Acidobacteriota bacterium]
MLDISVVIPVYNEQENLGPLYRRLKSALDPLDKTYEILFIDDGSRDGSLALLREMESGDPTVRILEFVRNFGQTAAIEAGFRHARGQVVIPMDADLQNDPADIPAILRTLEGGYDVVSCWRKNRQDPFLTRILPSRLANALISRISGVKLHDYGCTLKAYRRDIVRHIRLYGEMHRFIPIFATWAGARVTEIPVRHHPRQHGASKYGLMRTFKVLLDLITIKFLGKYSTKPMYLFGGLGMLSWVGGGLLSFLVLYQKYFEGVKAHRNPVLLIAFFLFIAGLQLILIGLIAELIVRIYHESQGKPTYILKDSGEDREDPASARLSEHPPAPQAAGKETTSS